MLTGPTVDEGNRIVYAFSGPRFDESTAALARRAARLEKAWHLPVTHWFTELKRANEMPERLRI